MKGGRLAVRHRMADESDGTLGEASANSRQTRRARRSQGAAALEFAIIAPIFLLLLFGVLAFGSVYFTLSSMKESAQDAARRMAVGAVTFTSGTVTCHAATAGSAEWYACRNLPPWGVFNVVATQDCTTMDDKVVLTTTGGSAALVDLLGLVGGRDFSVVSVMRKEGKCP